MFSTPLRVFYDIDKTPPQTRTYHQCLTTIRNVGNKLYYADIKHISIFSRYINSSFQNIKSSALKNWAGAATWWMAKSLKWVHSDFAEFRSVFPTRPPTALLSGFKSDNSCDGVSTFFVTYHLIKMAHPWNCYCFHGDELNTMCPIDQQYPWQPINHHSYQRDNRDIYHSDCENISNIFIHTRNFPISPQKFLHQFQEVYCKLDQRIDFFYHLIKLNYENYKDANMLVDVRLMTFFGQLNVFLWQNKSWFCPILSPSSILQEW